MADIMKIGHTVKAHRMCGVSSVVRTFIDGSNEEKMSVSMGYELVLVSWSQVRALSGMVR